MFKALEIYSIDYIDTKNGNYSLLYAPLIINNQLNLKSGLFSYNKETKTFERHGTKVNWDIIKQSGERVTDQLNPKFKESLLSFAESRV